MRVEIDGRLTAADFAAFYQSIDDLYQFLLFDRDPFFRKRGPYGRYIGYRLYRGEHLEVVQVKFASPGFTDLAGIASAVKQVREFLQFLITYVGASEDRRLDREQKKLEIQMQKVDLLKRLQEFPESLPDRSAYRRHCYPLEALNYPTLTR